MQTLKSEHTHVQADLVLHSSHMSFCSCSYAPAQVYDIPYKTDLFLILFREKGSHEFTLQQYLNRQRHILHGYEARRLKYVPKVG